MSLEDHVGDILKKARFIRGITCQTAATLARVPEQEYVQVEESGILPPSLDLSSLCSQLALSSEKVRRIATGWLPGPIDLNQWRELRCITTSNGSLSVHCYVVWDEITREAAVFDTGLDAAPLFALLDSEQLQLRHLFITHTHYDHIECMESIRARVPLVRLHTSAKSAPPQHRNRANDFLHLGNLRITNRDTPGHAEDGVTYIVGNFPEDAPSVAVVGDAIFAGSIGSAKFDPQITIGKIRDQILSLPPDTLICPGHGPLTTVAQERGNNPFF